MGLFKVLNRLFPAGRKAQRRRRRPRASDHTAPPFPPKLGGQGGTPAAAAEVAAPPPAPAAETAPAREREAEPVVRVYGRAIDLDWEPPPGATFSETVAAFEHQFAAKGWTVVRRRRGEGRGGEMVRWRIRKGALGGVITVVQANPDGTQVTVTSSFAVND